MSKHRLSNLFIAVVLVVAVLIVFSVYRAGAMKTVSSEANTTVSAQTHALPKPAVRYIAGEPAYQLPNGQWVR